MTPEQLWYITESCKAATPLVIGLIASYVAYRQWSTGHHKLKLELFDRRFNIYLAVRKITAQLASGSVADVARMKKFHRDVQSGRFLFGPDVIKLLAEVETVAHDYRSIERRRQTAEQQHDDDKLKALELELERAGSRIDKVEKRLFKKFRHYLDFGKI
jgi:hypothetical protein